jgi:hypothetical protein
MYPLVTTGIKAARVTNSLNIVYAHCILSHTRSKARAARSSLWMP